MSSDVTALASSTFYVQVPVQAVRGGLPYNPSVDAVSMAFKLGSSQPASADFHAGNWQSSAQGIYLAQCLVGPANGGVALTPGTYTVWVKIVDNPEVPILNSGSLQIL